MPQPSLWDQGLWEEARWSTVEVDGAITEGPDTALGGIALIDPIGGLIAEGPDVVVGAVTANQAVIASITENEDQTSGTVSVIQFVSGDITEGEDLANAEINVTNYLSGAITEGPDDVFGFIEPGPNSVFGNITEGEDVAESDIGIIVGVSGAIKEGRDKVRGNIFGPPGAKRPGGGWAPQFHYKREWELEVEAVIEPELDLSLEPNPYFIPQAAPIDPAAARIIQTILHGPSLVDHEEEDFEDILMHL